MISIFTIAFLFIFVVFAVPMFIDSIYSVSYRHLDTDYKIKLLFYLNSLRYNLLNLWLQVFPEKNAGEVDEIYVFPIKSVGYLKVNKWEVDEHGLKYDRQYAIGLFQEDSMSYKIITQRDCNKLSSVKIEYIEDDVQDWFRLYYMDDHSKYFEVPGKLTQDYIQQNCHTQEKSVVLWKNEFQTLEFNRNILPEAFLEWSGIAKKYAKNLDKVTLLYSRKGKFVKVGAPQELPTFRSSLFHDYYPLMMISKEDVEFMNRKLESDYTSEPDVKVVKPVNFRGNIIVKNIKKAFDTDTWSLFNLVSSDTNEKHLMKMATKCIRCVIPNIEVDQGQVDKKLRVSKTLNKYRRVDSGSSHATFGVNVIHIDSGYTIKTGDKFEICRRQLSVFEPIEPK